MHDLQEHERPLAERYRIAARAWRQADRLAKDYKENKEAVLSRMVMEAISQDSALATNKAERMVKASETWRIFLGKLVTAVNDAADLKIEMKAIEIEAEDIKNKNIQAARERRYG